MPHWQTEGNPDTDIGANSFLGTRANDPLRIRTRASVNNANVMTITPAPNATTTGNVGIGTPNPITALHVPERGLQIGFSNTVSDNFHITSDTVGGARGLRFWNGNYGTGSHILTALPNGNVGIGTRNPQRLLQVGDDVAGVGVAPADVSPNAGYVRWGDNTGWRLHFGRSRESPGGALNTGTTGVLMTIQDNGQVSIGTTEPAFSTALHVEREYVFPALAAIHSGGSAAGYSLGSRSYKGIQYDGRDGRRWEWYAYSDRDGRGTQGTDTSSLRLYSWTDRLYITAFGQMLLTGGLMGNFNYEVAYPDVLIGTLPGRPSSPPAAGELVLGAPRTSIRGFDGFVREDPANPKGMRLGYHWIRTNGNEDELWMAYSRARLFDVGSTDGLYRTMMAAVPWFGPGFHNTNSDARLKTNIRQVEGALEKLERIRGVAFDTAEAESPNALGGVRGEPRLGVVAQEVEEVLPEVVSTYDVASAEPDREDRQEYKAVDYDGLTGVLIEAVKALKAQNEELRSRIEALERA